MCVNAGYFAFNFRFSAGPFKYFIMRRRLRIYVRSHIIIADLRGTIGDACAPANGMRAYTHANKIPILLNDIALVEKKNSALCVNLLLRPFTYWHNIKIPRVFLLSA